MWAIEWSRDITCHFLLVVIGTKPVSLTVYEIYNVKCNAMVNVTLIPLLNKG